MSFFPRSHRSWGSSIHTFFSFQAFLLLAHRHIVVRSVKMQEEVAAVSSITIYTIRWYCRVHATGFLKPKPSPNLFGEDIILFLKLQITHTLCNVFANWTDLYRTSVWWIPHQKSPAMYFLTWFYRSPSLYMYCVSTQFNIHGWRLELHYVRLLCECHLIKKQKSWYRDSIPSPLQLW